MKKANVLIVCALVNCISSVRKECYTAFLNFNDEPCFNNSTTEFSDFFKGKICKDIACAGYAEHLKAHFCVHQKPREFRLMIFAKTANLTYDIPTFKDDERYTIKQIAVSDSHVSLLFNSLEAAYRMSFNIKGLGIENIIPLQYIGNANKIVWYPLVDSDTYMVINDKTFQFFHDNTTKNSSSSYQPCNNFKEYILNPIVNKTTTSVTFSTLSDYTTTTVSLNFFLICLLFGFIFVVSSFIAIFAFVHYKKSKSNARSVIQLSPATPNYHISPPSYRTQENDSSMLDPFLSANIRLPDSVGERPIHVQTTYLAESEHLSHSASIISIPNAANHSDPNTINNSLIAQIQSGSNNSLSCI